MRGIILILLIAGWTCLAVAERLQSHICAADLPFSLPISKNVANVGSLHYRSEFAVSSASFRFTNTSARPIVSVLAVVGLTDSRGQFMFNMLFHAFESGAYRRDHSRTSPAYQAQEAVQFDKPLMPGASRRWGMSSPFFSVACPSAAHASFLEIQYEDGPDLRHLDADAHREPVAIDASYIDLDGAPFVPPFEAMATIGVDTNGHPYVTKVDPGSEDFKQWLQKKVGQWEFSPAFSGPTPIRGELTILFRFHKDVLAQYPVPAPYPSVHLFQVADILPPVTGKWLWRVHLGRSVVSSKGIPDE